MSNTIVAAIYRYVIDDVVGNVQADFEGHGVDTSVLEELQRSWEAKIIQSRVADSNALARWQALRDARRAAALPQVDGAEDGNEEDRNHPGNGLDVAPKIELPEDAINSDLDDSDDEYDDEEGEETEHIILCQYDKVTRSKNKWKCVLRDGIMLINGRDFLFQKANGDFEW
ncbi:transcription factor IIA, alpha/beta subunit [Coemansia reversa NRRL 1564]|uniref:Transcription initiation factor IIA large subunit n=1 Tax=Coemansia reversa (strain ATCC 12441 / NRRL 1564) TaxID=763665 RepID=A0A2G5BCD5_COERN|nr:transcription factor IIA, alpha/beta subunit [Coemansia reversa NRRL 1564]|eukprot:PIA16684.1 transcription factor IIA, alpha/beta subunit [Coemansia reversa NRRL 1564]